MRQLGEQWIEELDGKKHMLKAVANTYNCNGCAYLGDTGKCLHSSILECPVYRLDAIVKDLGPVNEDGLLACPFCGEFPKGVSKGTEYKNDCEISIFYIEHSCNVVQTTEFTYSEQQSIDAWNRRAM